MEQLFFVCKKCGNLARLAVNNGAPLSCCGEEMTAVVPNTVDASKEKHVPVVTKEGNVISVSIGSVLHPMGEAHRILLVYLQTKSGGYLKRLAVDATPKVSFFVSNDDKPIAIYAYCNLHGLWMTAL